MKRDMRNIFLPDPDILQMIGQNDEEAFKILYKKYWRLLLKYAASYVNDEYICKEIVQELFVHLHSSSARLKIYSSFSSYLFVALRNKIFNYLRNQSVYEKHVKKAGRYGIRACNDVQQSIDLNELKRGIRFSLKRMPVKYSEVYILHDENSYTLKKISEILDRPVDTIEKQLRKARCLLRNDLRECRLN
jgi:RNA polymerase sigma factor (sigma-70 family)